jgi:hypothetical protein
MTLQDLGSLGEFVGAVAVVASFFYLAVQIRQNTRALHTSAYAQTAEQAWLVNLAIAQDKDLARIWADFAAGKSLIPEDNARIDAVLSNFFTGGEHTFRQYELGLLDSDTWENTVWNAYSLFPPAAYDRWRERKGPLTQRLLSYLESRGVLDAAAQQATVMEDEP